MRSARFALPLLVLVAALSALLVLVLSRTSPHTPRPGDDAELRPGETAPGQSGTGALAAQNERRGLTEAQWRKARRESETADDAPPTRVPWVHRLLSPDAGTPLEEDAVRAWVEAGHTNVEDLLAARQAGGGSEFLQRALELFPKDPRVLFASTALKSTPEEQRERLERFKDAAPSNSLANYLSAWNEFKAGNPEKALEELAVATTKSEFNDYTAEAWENTEKLLLAHGMSDAEAKALSGSSLLLPHLAQLKEVTRGLLDVRAEALAAGDQAGAERITQLGLHLGQQLADGPGSMTLIGELVGLTLERIILRDVPPDTELPYLQKSAGEVLSTVDTRRASTRESSQTFETWVRGASEPEILEYFQRLKSESESAALRWIREQPSPPAPAP
ncbi:MAG: hypothetical protein IT580_09775 [Verrucomicrobiales bacterium]|nr:hypothetical protein [Verrucomicrobiales bacterium]